MWWVVGGCEKVRKCERIGRGACDCFLFVKKGGATRLCRGLRSSGGVGRIPGLRCLEFEADRVRHLVVFKSPLSQILRWNYGLYPFLRFWWCPCFFGRVRAQRTVLWAKVVSCEVFHFLKTTQQTMMLSNMAACSFLKMKGYERKKFLRERRENRARNYPSNYYKSTELQGTIFLRTRCPVKV